MTIFMCIWEAIVFLFFCFFFFVLAFDLSSPEDLCRLEYLVTDLLNINGLHLLYQL